MLAYRVGLDIGLPEITGFPRTRPLFLAFVRASGWVFENRRFVRVFGPIRKYIRTLPIAKAYDGLRQRKLISFQYSMSVTSQNAILVTSFVYSVVNYQDTFSVKFCAQCEYSKTCYPICVICIWFCIVSIDPRQVIFAYIQVCEKSVFFFDSDNMVTLPRYKLNNTFPHSNVRIEHFGTDLTSEESVRIFCRLMFILLSNQNLHQFVR